MPGPQPYANTLFRFTPLFTPHPSKISLAKSPFPRYNTLKVKGSKGRAPAARRIASSPRVACRPGAYCEH